MIWLLLLVALVLGIRALRSRPTEHEAKAGEIFKLRIVFPDVQTRGNQLPPTIGPQRKRARRPRDGLIECSILA